MHEVLDAVNVWAEIDLSAVDHNVQRLKRYLTPGTRLLVPIKGNAYGHGAVPLAQQVLKSGADALGVARLGEAIELRRAGIDAPVLIFGYTNAAFGSDLVAYDLITTVYSLEHAAALSAVGVARGKKLKVHIKIDSGMGRLGLVVDELMGASVSAPQQSGVLETVEEITALPGLMAQGIFTHFSAADDPDNELTALQFQRFHALLEQLQARGIRFPLRHAANSAAIINYPCTHLDMVRPGIAVYGLAPSTAENSLDLRPVMSLKARVIQLKSVPGGFSVSYAGRYRTAAPTVVATVSIGYADGFFRCLDSKGVMLVRGRRAPVIGRVCMDLTMLDVGHIPDVALMDEVVIIGRQGDECISAGEIAEQVGTIHYEIVAAVSARVPRFYHH
jgi:alanine racemase